MVDPNRIEEAIQKITDQESFIRELLINALDWDFQSDDPEDWFFDVEPEELNLCEEDLQVFQLRPIIDTQPWGIFFIMFPDERVPILTLRTILRSLVKKKRTSADAAHRATWELEDLLFICTHDWKKYTFIHFAQTENIDKAARVTSFEFQPDVPHRTILEHNIPHLEWPEDTDNTDQWRSNWLQAFDVEKVTKRFYQEYDNVFKYVKKKITGFDRRNDEKHLFTQKLFNRLMFITFIQKKDWLKFNGSTDYLNALWNDHSTNKTDYESFYNHRLKVLFFTGLNNPNERDLTKRKDPATLEVIGDVPYLNGGLFEKEPDDELPNVKIPDEAIKRILDGLFNKFNFTVTESTPLDQEVAVDPEMLGKVFEELVTGRHDKGSYYTPKTIVSFMCKEALKGYLGGYEKLVTEHDPNGITVTQARKLLEKLKEIKICDPACGSGAYLVGMLHEIHALMRVLDTRIEEYLARDDYDRKLEIIQNNLYGVDIDSFAINIAQLRLWLTLAVEYDGDDPPPLPNLNFKIEIGDSLTAPDPTGRFEQTFAEEKIRKLFDLKFKYMKAHLGTDKDRIKTEIEKIKEDIHTWLFPGQTIKGFNWAVEFAEVFLDGGFDVIIANPPYGITPKDPLRFNFFPKAQYDGRQSKDSYGLFMARALQLLKKGGFFTFIVSDTWRTIRSFYPLRQKLLKETAVKHVLDLPAWIFGATVTTCILSLIKKTAEDNHELIAGDLRNLPKGTWYELEGNLRAVAERGVDVQTMTYARYTYPQKLIYSYSSLSFFIGSPELFPVMNNERYIRLGDVADSVHGISTGNNKKYIRVEQGTGGGYLEIEDWMKMSPTEMKGLSNAEKIKGVNKNWKKLDKCFVPLEKGGKSDAMQGWLANYYVPTNYYINWAKGSIIDMRKNKGAAWKNEKFFFMRGLTFSISGEYAPTFRFNSEGIFEAKGSGIFTDKVELNVLLSLLCSKIARYQFKVFIKHSVDTSGDDIKEFRFPKINDKQKTTLKNLVKKIVDKQKNDQYYSYHLYEQKEIDNLIHEMYGLTENEIREIELWYCRRYQKLAMAQGFFYEVKEKYANHLQRCEYIMSKSPEYWKSNPVLELIGQYEGGNLEFKETLAYDVRENVRNDDLVLSSLKTIAGFLNADGGKLLIGVSDIGEIKGLERDYPFVKPKNNDGFELKIRSLLESRFDPSPLGKVKINFEILPEGDVCVCNVEKSKEVVHLNGDVYVRDGNRTIKLTGPDLTKFIEGRS